MSVLKYTIPEISASTQLTTFQTVSSYIEYSITNIRKTNSEKSQVKSKYFLGKSPTSFALQCSTNILDASISR